MQRYAVALALAALTASACAPHRLYVRVGPPAPIVEASYAAPGPGYVWIPGYHRWDGSAYVWVSGRWTLSPRHHRAWVRGHWVESRHGWYWVEGYWSR
jgi:hypothetical protein